MYVDRLRTKKRANFSIDIGLNEYLSHVSKELGYKRTWIVEEALRLHLYDMLEFPNDNPIIESLEFRKKNNSY